VTGQFLTALWQDRGTHQRFLACIIVVHGQLWLAVHVAKGNIKNIVMWHW